MKMNSRTRLFLVFVSIVILVGAIIALAVYLAVPNLLAQNQLESDSNLGYTLLNNKFSGDWIEQDGKLYKGNTLLNGDNAFMDQFKNDTGIFAALYAKNINISTNITLSDGNRAIGINLPNDINNTVLVQGKQYTGSSAIDGQNMFAKFTPLLDKDNKIIGIWFVGFEKGKFNPQIIQIEKIIIGIIIIAIILIILSGFLYSIAITKSMSRVLVPIEAIASGNLRCKTNFDENDDIGIIGNNINHMIDKITHLVKNIKKSSSKINLSSKEVLVSTDNIKVNYDMMLQEINKINEGAILQAQSANQGSNKVKEISQELKNINQDMSKSEDLVKKAIDTVTNGEDLVKVQEKKLDINKNIYLNIKEVIPALLDRSSEIGQVTQAIKEFAETTNILALNAAIEADKVGDQGKGFAVVASKIRDLAEKSSESVNKITQITRDVNNSIENTVSQINNMGPVLHDHEIALKETVDAFNEISGVIVSMALNIKNVYGSIRALNDEAAQADKAIGNIAVSSKNTSEAINKAVLFTKDQMEIISQISNEAQGLTEIADDLKENIEKFNV